MYTSELIFVLSFVATIINGQKFQTSEAFELSTRWKLVRKQEEEICKQYNAREIVWKCTQIADCKWKNNSLKIENEHRCGTDRICCPEKTNSSTPTQTPKPTPTPTRAPTKPTPTPTRTTKKTTPRTRPTTSLPKTYAQIAKKKCAEYAQYRYVTECVGGDLPGQEVVCERKLDCEIFISLVGNPREEQYPHMALIGYGADVENITWSCSGSLISDRFVLSAAHCTQENKRLNARWIAVGLLLRGEATGDKLGKNVFPILRTYNHPDYRDAKADYDITLYEIKPLELSSHIRPICLHTNDSLPSDAIITGWGLGDFDYDGFNELQEARISILSNSKCKTHYKNEKNLAKGFDEKSMICVGDETHKRDSCFGDPGGPLQIKLKETCMYSQVGVNSLDCDDNGPGLYTRVSAYIDWIGKIVWPDEMTVKSAPRNGTLPTEPRH